DLKPESMPRHLELMRRFGPKMIYGYGVAIYRLADYAREHGIDLRVP
ncbi:MAG: capsule biosynthesis protein CapK, partial [Armatimonadetes bacterium CG_4_10_14_0_8_um_filter_66_14]